MKKLHLLLLIVSPLIIGLSMTISTYIPVVNRMVGLLVESFFLPVLVIVFWFWVGRKFATVFNNPFTAILIGNIFGVISLVFSYSHFVLSAFEQRIFMLIVNVFINALALLSIPAEFIGLLFNVREILSVELQFMFFQATGYLLMVVIFFAGYIYGKKKSGQKIWQMSNK